MDFLVPRYFAGFKCKMGDCRSACCVGWPVTVSMKNYFTLLGLPCRKELRDRLDCALRVLDRPTEEEYARFSPNWLGDCPMRMEDGRCSIHAELGEEVLSDVCRLYPRGVRLWNGRYECSASNSCEKTLELLWDEADPMTFSVRDLPVTPPPYPGSPTPTEGVPMTEEFRFSLIGAMQDRTRTVRERLGDLRTLMDCGPMEGKGNALETALRMTAYYADRSESIREAGETVLERWRDHPAQVRKDAEDFANRFPDWERFWEQMLVNHMFFTQFPYGGIAREDAWNSLAAVYGLTRILAVGTLAGKDPGGAEADRCALADVLASAFRLIAHTPFERSVGAALGDGYAADLLLL